MDDLFNDLISNILWLLLGTCVAGLLRYLRLTRPIHWFWRLEPDSKVLTSTYQSAQRRFYIPTGDSLAVAEVTSLLNRNYRKLTHAFYPDPQTAITEWDSATVLIGGGKDNVTVRCLLAALALPLHAYDHEHPQRDFKGLKNTRNETIIDESYTPHSSPEHWIL